MYGFYPTQQMLQFHATKDGKKITKPHFTLDKTRSLLLMFKAIKTSQMQFPSWRSFEAIAKDILSLEDSWSSTQRGRDILSIRREKQRSDDAADAINYAFMILLHKYDALGAGASKRILDGKSPDELGNLLDQVEPT